MHKIAGKSWSEKIFKAYDIRGAYPAEINEDAVYKIARAFVRYLRLGSLARRSFSEGGAEGRSLKIVVSSDARPSSPALKEAFMDGLIDEGAEIIDAGLTTTPMHYFTVNVAGADGGAMITASHNPAEFNGIKLSKKGALPIGEGAGMEEIKNDAVRGIFASSSGDNSKKGSVSKYDFTEKYIYFLFEHFPLLPESAVSLSADASNGMASILLEKLFARFPKMKVGYLHGELDMTFPNHEANPLKAENLKDVQAEVLKNKSAIGISFDGDGDRVGFVDENGKIIPGDIVTALLVRYFAKTKGEAVVYDLRSSRVVREEIEKAGLRPVESRVGHAFIKATMRKENAVLGGEVSGHYYFRDFFYCDSAVFAALAVLDLMRIEKKPLSGLIKPLLKYVKSEEINFAVKNKELILDKVAAYFPDAKISYLDGIKVEYPHWWFNLRISNTEDVVRLNIEAILPELLDEKKKLISELLAE
ncbi:hypothetical protein A2662_04135 [Candidatus Giovannonibacteria bacterium RIFCSPHIGHO2_01_FULL_45_33]|uniref:Phosphomannomutase/phosphoglucomutase n=1 Tax=Candidatus Yanofskybacteria bacterium RIFCSPLOWO2_01_FULL_49_25 TaxID=1802701 RepID=A0A1F8GUE5_9BACT|nr:MAG: hypothetical protein A2662_04135 [Candidatus Giovannonibacteria bacterium RIFCSPHIGHO2_01_FULL_45_33]OGF70447.1 MAG: hypothetical protein A3C73_02585 [Candidatus Giovannonibacteria bacterium RIFCSPHIGHO2_02_FULL_44_11]OGN28258.1 MAG: hypothetical protein A3A33_02025 [Candidatus Yanofskybacteria bacterium RIFCSPLOWO2_01_FULL_49_25]